jgi:predicted transglutaminase-like cysteine proteinase
MFGFFGRFTFGALCVVAATSLTVAARSAPRHASFAPLGGPATTPFGWTDCCHRYGAECAANLDLVPSLPLTAALWSDPETVNHRINAAIEPRSDGSHWGVIDQWDDPTDANGDREDDALLKRKILMSIGYSQSLGLLTVLQDHSGAGHAVLAVTTDDSDLVLDNQSDLILPWDQTGYLFVKRQSPQDPNIWFSINGNVVSPMTTARSEVPSNRAA